MPLASTRSQMPHAAAKHAIDPRRVEQKQESILPFICFMRSAIFVLIGSLAFAKESNVCVCVRGHKRRLGLIYDEVISN